MMESDAYGCSVIPSVYTAKLTGELPQQQSLDFQFSDTALNRTMRLVRSTTETATDSHLKLKAVSEGVFGSYGVSKAALWMSLNEGGMNPASNNGKSTALYSFSS